MAFGKIAVVPQRIKASRPKQSEPAVRVRKTAPVLEKGTSVMEVLLIAPTGEEAWDFLSGLYFDLIQAVSGSQLTAYTREFSTINRLSENKQLLEETIAKPVGREFVRRPAEDGLPMEQCTITVGQSGNPALTLDLHVTWVTPAGTGGRQADVVFALLNCAEGRQAAAECMRAAKSAAAGHPVFWILSNFEQQSLFGPSDGGSVPRVQLRDSLRELLEVSCGAWEFASYAQVYGGLEFVRREDGKAVLRTDYRCREYAPVACHVPVFVAVEVLRRYRANQNESAAPDAALEKIWLLMQPQYELVRGWYDNGANGGSGK